MFTATQRFADALLSSHVRTVGVDVMRGTALLATDLPIVAGSLTIDGGADVRSTVRLTVADPTGELVPYAFTDALAPYGSELIIRAGIRFADGATEDVPMGRFRITDVNAKQRWTWVDADPEGRWPGRWINRGAQIDVVAQDRMMLVQRAGLTEKYTPAAGASVSGEIRYYIGSLIPISALPTQDATVPAGTVYDLGDGSRMAAMKKILPSNWTYYVDRSGNFVASVIPFDTPDPVLTVSAGPAGTVVSAEHTWTSEQVYNAVVVTGQASADLGVLRGIAFETDGPTAWGSLFGYAPMFRTDNLPQTTQPVLDEAARTYLATNIHGRDRQITVTVPPDPRIDQEDIVRVVLPAQTFTGRVIGIAFPLTVGSGGMTLVLDVAETAISASVPLTAAQLKALQAGHGDDHDAGHDGPTEVVA